MMTIPISMILKDQNFKEYSEEYQFKIDKNIYYT